MFFNGSVCTICFVVSAFEIACPAQFRHEFNKAKDYEELEGKYNETLLRLNETLGYGNSGYGNLR